ncbi:uroporphyrinogen-III C-methyltransferase [Novipirellula artificiosorum]|uniref:uroporphyrinogen-III C-methyltransferase n=1 Tax=Novipirellula artificiosorum TaxID=2528016 RepID=A0A5C6DJ21_9BACT|nr:uroporphyrinogen-III C-methyltransferase [Novipirellula artificiosorum]TWU35897.1 Uroporphyrinogen-III C-methyltransferase [Novipirellula artificiosorum]
MDPMSGMVYLIGAGPGDPGLLTLRGAELLGRSDVVLYDGLSNVELLHQAPSAQHICVGKHGQQRIWRQDEIANAMITHAMAGRTVARLKGGDPAVFARTTEEVDALVDAGIRYEIVPGITAALAAGSYAGIPITHRKLASAVALVTGHEEPGKAESALDWDALARFPGTLVIYMGVTTAGHWTRSLIDAGKSPGTPAAIVRRCSLPDQQTFHCRLDEVADRLTPASKIRPPVIVILGPVAELAETRSWIAPRPMLGRSVLVTRPSDQVDPLVGLLRDLGATVLVQPAIAIGPPTDWAAVDAAIRQLHEQDFVVFSSRNGIRFFLNRVLALDLDTRVFATCQIACVGQKTAEALQDFHLRADWIPKDFRAESLAEALSDQVSGKRVLLVRASRGRDVLARSLSAAGAEVSEVTAYQHTDVVSADAKILELASDGKIDWITVTSSATAENLHRMFGASIKHSRVASLSPVTSETLRSLGYTVDAEANPYTMQSLVQKILETEEGK